MTPVDKTPSNPVWPWRSEDDQNFAAIVERGKWYLLRSEEARSRCAVLELENVRLRAEKGALPSNPLVDALELEAHIFALDMNETVKIGEASYRYIGQGMVEGPTNPDEARRMRDAPLVLEAPGQLSRLHRPRSR